MVSVLALLQIIILIGLAVLLLAEEYRYRHFVRRVETMRLSLQALSDQVRSPLALLRKYHSFLRRQEFGKLTMTQQEVMSGIDRAIADIAVSHDRLLARARIEDHPQSTGERVLGVDQVIRSAVNAVTPMAEERKHVIRVTPAGNSFVKADALVLHGILDELLMNAISYMEPGGSIRVTSRKNGPRVDINIQDTGIGIEKSEQPLVFGKFFRGEVARRMAPGTGLGLFFAKQFARDLKGDVRFTTKPGKGSTFVLSLPKAKA